MKWAKRLCLIASLVLPNALLAQAQVGRVTGTVTDSATSQPLAGVTVLVVGTQHAAITSNEGRYTIVNVPAGPHRLRAQRIGYGLREQSIVVTAGQTLTVPFTMRTQAVQLNTVVSVGYGTQSRRDVTGSVATVTLDAVESAPITTIDQVLQGTSPGVQVTTASSEPGGALTVRIRGASSITGNNEPLYVIDGFPIENDIEGSSAGNGGRTRTTPANPLATLNPSDIESISILKDASSTAIYGARGANGVVIITTKQGRGTKPVFSLDFYTGAQQVAKKYALLSTPEYIEYANLFGQNSSNAYTPFPDSVKQQILASGINTDWQDEIFRTAGVRNFQLSVRGATSTANTTRYNLSGGVFDQDGIVVGSGLRRLSSRLNLNQSFGSRVEFGGSFTASQARTKAVNTAGQQNGNAGAVSGALQYVPILPVRLADGTYSYINRDLNAYSTLLDAPQTPNPVSLTEEVKDSLSDTRLLGSIFGQFTLLPGLQLRVSGGADYANRGRYTYYPRTTLRGQQANGEAIRASTVTSSWLNENTLTYESRFRDIHNLSLLGGYTRQQTDVSGENMNNTNFVSDITGYFDIGAGTQEGGPGISSRRTTQALESWLGRINYGLLDRYLFTFTYRADGSSRFAANKKWGSFPSAAVAWRLSSEPFMQGIESLDELKVRASYGVVGNPSIRPYQSLARLNDQGYSFGGTPYAGYYPTAVGNPDLTWETTKQTDIGFDLGLFERLTFVADYYEKRTTDLLLQVSLPFESGFESALRNLGTVDNKGFEFALDARIFEPAKRGGFAWRTNLNYAANKNRVIDLGGTNVPEVLITTDYNLPGTRAILGKPLGTFYGFRAAGVIRDQAQADTVTWTNFNNSKFTPGDMLIMDIAGKKDSLGNDIGPDGKITLDDQTDIGDPTPRFTMGLTNTIGWRGFELSGLLQGSFGGKVLNVNRIRTEGSPRVNVARERFRDAWSDSNPNGRFPAIGENPNQVGPNSFSSNLLEDATYIRLRTLTLAYSLPQSLLGRANFSGGRVYVTGTNLWTKTDYSGFDPDVSSQSVGAMNRGIDIGAYPLARTVTVGLNFNY